MLNDKTLIEQCLKGDEKSQKRLYDKYSSTLMGVCYRYAKNVEDAEDILQEAFIKIFTSMYQFRHEGSFEGWMKRVTVTTSLNYMNHNKQIKESLTLDSMAYEVPTHAEEASIRLSGKDLMDCIQTLPVGYKAVLNLFAIEGFSHREIAEMLDISEGTSRSQYARAKALLAVRILEQNKILIPTQKLG